jgi:hypothetical protein
MSEFLCSALEIKEVIDLFSIQSWEREGNSGGYSFGDVWVDPTITQDGVKSTLKYT